MFNKAPKNNNQKMFKFNLYWMYGLIFIMLFALYLTNDSSASKELGWTEFQKLAQENVFDRMVVYNKKNLVEATVKDGRYFDIHFRVCTQCRTVFSDRKSVV